MTPKPTSIPKVVVLTALLNVAVLVVLALLFDRNVAEKTAVNLAMPAGLLWFLLNVMLFVSWRRCSRPVFALLFSIWCGYTLCGNGLFAEWAAGTLESPFSDIAPLSEPPFHAVILLGGGATQAANLRHQGNGSGDRLILAAQLYHEGLTERLICTGRRIQTMNSLAFDPADQSEDILRKLGVPAAAIEKLGGRNTSEEMQTLGTRFADTDHRVGVVTSAWHLRRALSLARRNGFNPRPLPANFMTGPARRRTTGEILNSMIPQGGAFMTLAQVLKEYLGVLVGR